MVIDTFQKRFCDEDVAQTMFFQSQAFLIETSQILSGLFWFPKKSEICSKKARISKSSFKKNKLATLAARSAVQHCNPLHNKPVAVAPEDQVNVLM